MGEPDRDEPSLELKLPRLRRPRRKARPVAPTPAPAPTPTPTSGEQPPVSQPQTATTVAEPPPPPPPPPRAPRVRRPRPTVRIPGGWPAVVVTGALVGLVVVGLTWLSLRTCEAVQGTSTCGTAGYPMLLLVLVVAVLVGGLLLRLAQVPDPVSTSLLGVGVAAVLALVFLIGRLDHPAMVVVIPLICVATFAGSHWLTTTVIEPERD